MREIVRKRVKGFRPAILSPVPDRDWQARPMTLVMGKNPSVRIPSCKDGG